MSIEPIRATLYSAQQGHQVFARAWHGLKPALLAGHQAEIEVRPLRRSCPQNAKLHAMFTDVARDCQFMGQSWDAECWKRLLVDSFQRATLQDPDLAPYWRQVGTLRTVPSLDGQGVVTLGAQTRRFPKPLASAFIEWLLAWGVEAGVKFNGDDE